MSSISSLDDMRHCSPDKLPKERLGSWLAYTVLHVRKYCKLTQSKLVGLGQANQIDMLNLSYSYPQADLQTKMFQMCGMDSIFSEEPKFCSTSICQSGNVWQISLKWVVFLQKWVANLKIVWQWVEEWQEINKFHLLIPWWVATPVVRPKMSKNTPNVWQLAGIHRQTVKFAWSESRAGLHRNQQVYLWCLKLSLAPIITLYTTQSFLSAATGCLRGGSGWNHDIPAV